MLTIGVLALQGDVADHLRVLDGLGVRSVAVRRPAELDACDGLVLPGGESTTMIKLARTFELVDPLRRWVGEGRPVLGTCAGMILLADRLADASGQETIGGLDVTVRRNAFGRQVDSFETDLEVAGVDGGPMHAVFIRAPWVEETGPRVEVLASVAEGPAAGRVVACRQGALIATSFHPEVGGEPRIHALLVAAARDAAGRPQ